jgi:predicted glycoside hydrolase/deacetylase ChbG (UPF0249 family)
MTLPADLSPVERQHLRAQAEALHRNVSTNCSMCEWVTKTCRGCLAAIAEIEDALLAQRLQGRTEGGPAWRPQIEQLIEKWRDHSREAGEIAEASTVPQFIDESVAARETFTECADDLAAVLCALPASPSVSPTAQKDQDTHTRGVGE